MVFGLDIFRRDRARGMRGYSPPEEVSRFGPHHPVLPGRTGCLPNEARPFMLF